MTLSKQFELFYIVHLSGPMTQTDTFIHYNSECKCQEEKKNNYIHCIIARNFVF